SAAGYRGTGGRCTPRRGAASAAGSPASQPPARSIDWSGSAQATRIAAAHSPPGGPARPGAAVAQASDPTFFLSHSSSILSRPICSNSSAFSASASAAAALLPLPKTWSAPASSCFFQAWIRAGWTPYWLASSLTVLSPFRVANATWALNAAVCCFLLPAIVPPFLGHQSSLAGGPVL